MYLYKFPFGPLSTNAILIGCAKTHEAAVIDPSLGSAPALLEKAHEHSLNINKILLTHSHWDHFADAAELMAKTNAPLFVHPLDVKNITHPGSDGIPLFFAISPVKPTNYLQEQDIVHVGQLKLEVIHCPGHSPGGVSFYLRDQNVLLSGDTLFRGSIGNLSLPTANPADMWQSLQKLAKLPAQTRVIPGHGADTTIGHEDWLNRAEQVFS